MARVSGWQTAICLFITLSAGDHGPWAQPPSWDCNGRSAGDCRLHHHCATSLACPAQDPVKRQRNPALKGDFYAPATPAAPEQLVNWL